MDELGNALLLLALLLLGSYAGIRFQRRLRDQHRSRETIESVRLAITILATFAALVLGLLVTSVKSNFDANTDALRHFSVTLIQLDARLREYGPQADPIRTMLRGYTAAAILDTWPNEAAPTGNYPRTLDKHSTIESRKLTDMMSQIDATIQALQPGNPLQTRIAALARAGISAAIQARWNVIERAIPTISWPFLTLLMLWLVIIFTVFGLTSPGNAVVNFVILLSAISVASSIYLILDLDAPFSGFMQVSSQPMRDALMHMDQSTSQPAG